MSSHLSSKKLKDSPRGKRSEAKKDPSKIETPTINAQKLLGSNKTSSGEDGQSKDQPSSNLSDQLNSVESKSVQKGGTSGGNSGGHSGEMNSSLNNSKSWGIQSNPSSQNIHSDTNQDAPDEEQKQSGADSHKEEMEKLHIQFELEKSMIDMKYKQQLTALEK